MHFTKYISLPLFINYVMFAMLMFACNIFSYHPEFLEIAIH